MTDSTFIFDLESDGLLDTITKIHCVVVLNYKTRQYQEFTKPDVAWYTWINSIDVLVCHNIIGYDLEALKKVGWIEDWDINEKGNCDITYKYDKVRSKRFTVVDSLILSKLMNPDRGRHGLEAWGKRNQRPKPLIEDWKNLTQGEYVHRCKEDVINNMITLNKLTEESNF